ncbi:MAG: YbjN domain-containing protein [Gammaproteobacteria bacterium]|nr:YbjN domain-containing protein [Betaproteobacteria bacterium]MBM4231744.1 YbjN domain-containing protein [Gammaproteobacteria bacterium]
MVLSMAPWANAQQRTTGTPSGTSQVVESVTATQMLSLMKAEGYAVEADSDGDLVWKIDGTKTLMLISKDRSSLQLFASFVDGNATLKKVNEWNKSKRYSRTYLDEDGDPCLELDLDLDGGVTFARITDYLKTCRISYQAWCQEVVK